MRQDKLSTVEFVALFALIASLVAMSIDAMLPALSDIAFSLGATGPNVRQLVLSSLFLGLSCAQLFSQQILQELYGRGARFPVYFGVLALTIGLASFVNASLVMRFGMRDLCAAALRALTLLALGYLAFATRGGLPPLWTFMAFLLGTASPMPVAAGTASAA